MQIKAKNLITFIIITKLISPILALIYLVSWVLQAVNPKLFSFVNLFIGFLPKIFDKFMHIETILGDRLVSMSYVYCACLFALFFYFSNVIIKNLEKVDKIQRTNEIKKRMAQQELLKRKREAQRSKQAQEVKEEPAAYAPPLERKTFFGLFEFQLKYYDVYGKDPAALHSLRKGFSKIMVQKLQETYKDIEFYADERVFFSCKEFSNFRLITKDILTLMRTFIQAGMCQSIKVGMLFSYWAGNDGSDKDEIFKILNRINELGYLNKIIVSSGIYFRFSKENDRKLMSFDPLGATRLTNVTADGDLDIDLYSVTKVE